MLISPACRRSNCRTAASETLAECAAYILELPKKRQ